MKEGYPITGAWYKGGTITISSHQIMTQPRFKPVSAQMRTRVLALGLGWSRPRQVLVKMDTQHLAYLTDAITRARHVATLSHGRQRVLLVLMRDDTVVGAPATCMLVDVSRRTVVSVRLAFDASLFDDTTVFEGELVVSREKVMFLVDDLLFIRGAALGTCIQQRQDTVIRILGGGHLADRSFDDLQVIIKSMCHLHDLSPLINLVGTLPYLTDYITFRPMEPMPMGVQLTWFYLPLPPACAPQPVLQPVRLLVPDPPPLPRVLPPPSTSKQVQRAARMMIVRRTGLPDVYEVLDGEWRIACLPTLLASRFMRHIFSDTHTQRRVRCSFNVAFQKWEPAVAESFSPIGVTDNGIEPVNGFGSSTSQCTHGGGRDEESGKEQEQEQE